MSTSVVVTACVLLCSLMIDLCPTSATPLATYFKKSSVDCVGAEGKCFNTEECCGGFTCAADDNEDDSVETPGRCIRAKNLTPCTSDDDCRAMDDELCSALNDAAGQRYCLPSSSTSSDSTEQLQQLLQARAPGKHQAFSRQLSEYGGSCTTSEDCQPFAQFSQDTKIRVCCQEVRRGRQGNRRICDRITPISICIQPSDI